jgi:hypothetical protein
LVWHPCFLLDDRKCRCHFFHNVVETGFQERLLRVHNYIYGKIVRRPLRSNCLAQTALHAIAIDGASQDTADGKTYAQSQFFLPTQEKNGHVMGKVPASLFINALEIRMA